MKRITIITACFLICLNLSAQMADSSMKKWTDYMTPGKEHKMMASWNGTWTGEISLWMAPGATPTKSTGTSVNTMIMDGRYQQSTTTGSFEGMPFNGMSTLAFDNAKKVFISTWIDNMGTGVMIGKGTWNEATKSMTIRGTMVDPMTGKDCDFREVMKVLDNDHQVMEMYVPDTAGKEYKSMEIKYTRNK
jgi:hypothetical protein